MLANPTVKHIAARLAKRYVAGNDATAALDLLQVNTARGHRGNIELVGESVRQATIANEQTEEFTELVRRIGAAPETATVSFDLSHTRPKLRGPA